MPAPSRVLLVGKKGCGKSSIAEALADQLPGCELVEEPLASPDPGRVRAQGERIERFVRGAPHDTVAVCLVVGAPDRALEAERLLAAEIRRRIGVEGFSVFCSRIDMLPPVRAPWDPESQDPLGPNSKKGRNIYEYLEYVLNTLDVDPSCAVPVAPGADPPYGREVVADLLHRIGCFGELPGSKYAPSEEVQSEHSSVPHAHFGKDVDASGTSAADVVRDKQARAVILAASAAAGGAGLIPGAPISTAAVLAIQAGMIARLHALHKPAQPLSGAAATLVGTAGYRVLAMLLRRFVPGLGLLIGPGAAASATIAVGEAYLKMVKQEQR